MQDEFMLPPLSKLTAPRKRKKPLKLFVWEEFQPDWSHGLAFAIAATEEQAKQYVTTEMGYDHVNYIDWGPVLVFPVNKRIGRGVCGGG